MNTTLLSLTINLIAKGMRPAGREAGSPLSIRHSERLIWADGLSCNERWLKKMMRREHSLGATRTESAEMAPERGIGSHRKGKGRSSDLGQTVSDAAGEDGRSVLFVQPARDDGWLETKRNLSYSVSLLLG